MIELAPLADPALIAQTIATALGVREEPARPLLATLAAHLRDKQLLLVLGNCEHLIDGCALLAEDLLRAAPLLRILASSREPLGSGGEAIYRVPPLAVPNPSQPSPLGQLGRYEAVQLFVERAQAVQPAFQVTETNAEALAQICRRLDGIPLAIELAAARVRMLPVAQIAARLDDRFRLLTGGSRTALPRHQALQALIDWSYELLADDERVLLRRLAVFVGGWTLEDAEAVCADVGLGAEAEPIQRSTSNIQNTEALGLLTHLVDKSLVEVEPGETAARYRMLETIRQYALAKLAASSEADAVRHRHALYYLAVAEGLAPDQLEFNWTERMAQLETEHDNVRAALAWSRVVDGAEIGLRLVKELAEIGLRLVKELEVFWALRGYWTEARSWLTDALAHPEASGRTQLRAEVLYSLGSMHAYLNDYAPGQAAFAESLSIYLEIGDTAGHAWVLNRLGWVAREQGDTTAARAQLEQSLALFRDLGDRAGVAWCLAGLGSVAGLGGQPERAARLWGAAEALRAALGARPAPASHATYERAVTAMRAALGAEAFAAAWAAGQALPPEEAIASALEDRLSDSGALREPL